MKRGAGAVATSIAAHPRSFAELRVLIEPQPFARSLLHAHSIRALDRSIFAACQSAVNNYHSSIIVRRNQYSEANGGEIPSIVEEIFSPITGHIHLAEVQLEQIFRRGG